MGGDRRHQERDALLLCSFLSPIFSFSFSAAAYTSISTKTVCGLSLFLSSLSILSKHLQHRLQQRFIRNHTHLPMRQNTQQNRIRPTTPPMPIAIHCQRGRPATSSPPKTLSSCASVVSPMISTSSTSGYARISASYCAARISSGVGPVNGASTPLMKTARSSPVQRPATQEPLRH